MVNTNPFSWRISVDGRPNRRDLSCVFKFLRRSVDEAKNLFTSKNINSVNSVIISQGINKRTYNQRSLHLFSQNLSKQVLL